MKHEVNLLGTWRFYRLGEGENEGYFEVLMDNRWQRLADITEQRENFKTR